MTAILRNESGKLLRGTLTLTGLLVLLSALFLLVFPAIQDEAELIEEVYPEYVLRLLGIEELHTIEGFVSSFTVENEETLTGDLASVVDDPDEDALEGILGASADERSVEVNGDRVAATAAWREQD